MTNRLFKKHLLIIEAGHLSKKSASGGDLIMQGMAEYIRDSYKITVILPSFAYNLWLKKSSINFIKIPSDVFDKSNSAPSVFLNYLLRITKILRQDINLSHSSIIYSSTNAFVDTIPAFIIKLKNPAIPWIARVHHLTENPFSRDGSFLVNLVSYIMEKISLILLNQADLVICLNQNLKKSLTNKGFSPKKLDVLGAGIDLKYFSDKKLPVQKVYDAVYLGRLHRTKGILDLPEIWFHVTQQIPSSRLAVIGEIPDKSLYLKFIKKIRQYKLQSSIKVKGFLKSSDVKTVLSSSRIFLFTDHEAGYGIACAQAMAAGLPVVGWDIGILGDVFRKGFLKAPPTNCKMFADCIIKILKDKRLHSRLVHEAQTEAVHHDWQITSRKFESILDKISL